MATSADLSSANGMAKDVFGKLKEVLPESGLKFTNRVKFDSSNTLGDELKEVVWLTHEHGFTYNGNSGAKVTLNESTVAESKETTIKGNEIIFRTEIVYALLQRTVKAGKTAFESYWSRAFMNAKKSFNKRVEVAMLRGGRSLATLTSATNPTATTSVMTITDATFGPGFWVGMRNAPLDAYNSSTKLNTNADIVITSVDIKNKTLTVSLAAADLTAIRAVGTNGSGVELYYKGTYGTDGTGLIGIANLTSGTYAGIAGSTYSDVWNGTQVAVDSNQLDWDWVQNGLEEAAGRGCETPLVLLVSNPAWNNLNSDLAALRVLDSSYKVKETEIGTQSIVFHSVTGRVEIVPSNYIHYGEAVAYPDPSESDMRRVGSTPITFDPSTKDGEQGAFRHVENSNTVELRAWSDQALYTTQVRDCIYWSGISN